MPHFNVSRRFRMFSDSKNSNRKAACYAGFDNVENLNSLDDRVLSQMAESIVRELAEKGILARQIRKTLYGNDIVLSDRELPAVSLGPSGIKGDYQVEI